MQPPTHMLLQSLLYFMQAMTVSHFLQMQLMTKILWGTDRIVLGRAPIHTNVHMHVSA